MCASSHGWHIHVDYSVNPVYIRKGESNTKIVSLHFVAGKTSSSDYDNSTSNSQLILGELPSKDDAVADALSDDDDVVDAVAPSSPVNDVKCASSLELQSSGAFYDGEIADSGELVDQSSTQQLDDDYNTADTPGKPRDLYCQPRTLSCRNCYIKVSGLSGGICVYLTSHATTVPFCKRDTFSTCTLFAAFRLFQAPAGGQLAIRTRIAKSQRHQL